MFQPKAPTTKIDSQSPEGKEALSKLALTQALSKKKNPFSKSK